MAWLAADEFQPVHQIAGYTGAGPVAFRLVWGQGGRRYARFDQCMRGPTATLSYLGGMTRGRERRYRGHNPAGAAVVVALFFTLAGTAFTGWLLEEQIRAAMLPVLPQFVAPANADEDGEEYGEAGSEGPLKDVHETLANLMLVLAALHVSGAVLASFRRHGNLALAMVTGGKRAPEPGDTC